MEKKLTCEELEQRVKELGKESLERKPAEETLPESEQLYRALFELGSPLFSLGQRSWHFGIQGQGTRERGV